MKKGICMLLVLVTMLLFAACASEGGKKVEPQISQMEAICNLAVMDCYYHNVTKVSEKDAQVFLWWKKDKRFWIEYSATVRLGIDVSQLSLDVTGDVVTISIPPAKVLSCQVDSKSLTKDSYIMDTGSVKINAEDERSAFELAEIQLKADAESNTVLLAGAQQRAQSLLEEYVRNIGAAAGREYSVKWVYLTA